MRARRKVDRWVVFASKGIAVVVAWWEERVGLGRRSRGGLGAGAVVDEGLICPCGTTHDLDQLLLLLQDAAQLRCALCSCFRFRWYLFRGKGGISGCQVLAGCG